MFGLYKKLGIDDIDKKIFGTLFFSIFAAVTGVGIVVPLLPVYAHDLGAGGFYIALIFGSFSLSRTFFLPYFGRLSDKIGRKILIATGLISYALISLAFVFSHDVESLIILRFIQGIASAMIMPVTQAYVGDITPAGSEGTVMGIFHIAVFFGLSIGPLIGGVINDQFTITASFICMGFLAFVGFLLSLFLLPPTRLEKVVCRGTEPVAWRQLICDMEIIGIIFFRFSYTLCIGVIWSFMPILGASDFSLSSSHIGILVMIGVFISGLLHAPMGFLADRTNRRTMIIIGGLITCIAIFSFEWANNFRHLLLANIFFGIGGGISMPALMAIVVLKGEETGSMGAVMGLLTMAHSSGMLVGALLGGFMMDFFHLRQAFLIGALAMLLGVILFTVCGDRKKSTCAVGH